MAVPAHDCGSRQRKTLLRPDDVDDALPFIELVEIFEPKQLGVLRQISDLRRTFRVGVWLGAVGGGDIMVDHQKRLVGGMDLAAGQSQPLECLRTRDLVNEMPVDIDQAGAIRLLVDQVVFPDLVVKSARGHNGDPVASVGDGADGLERVPVDGTRPVPVNSALSFPRKARIQDFYSTNGV